MSTQPCYDIMKLYKKAGKKFNASRCEACLADATDLETAQLYLHPGVT